jgi:uncharacterized protein (DUF2267 family)
MNRPQYDTFSGGRSHKENENYGIDPEAWQRENISLRGGRRSSFGVQAGDSENIDNEGRRAYIKNKEQYDFAVNAGPYVHYDRPGDPRKQRIRSMNFEEYAAEGNRLINEVSAEMGCDRNTAARVTKAILHAVRDRLPPIDAVQFAQGLPMAIRGVYFDQYDISRTPVLIRSVPAFLEFIRDKNHQSAVIDFPYPQDVVHALQAVFRVLSRNMDWGQVNQIIHLLPKNIAHLIDSRRYDDL